jgi:hypothetical protein
MPKRTDLQSTLILGSGPIVIGHAAEIDYSGTHVRPLPMRGIHASQSLREAGPNTCE